MASKKRTPDEMSMMEVPCVIAEIAEQFFGAIDNFEKTYPNATDDLVEQLKKVQTFCAEKLENSKKKELIYAIIVKLTEKFGENEELNSLIDQITSADIIIEHDQLITDKYDPNIGRDMYSTRKILKFGAKGSSKLILTRYFYGDDYKGIYRVYISTSDTSTESVDLFEIDEDESGYDSQAERNDESGDVSGLKFENTEIETAYQHLQFKNVTSDLFLNFIVAAYEIMEDYIVK